MNRKNLIAIACVITVMAMTGAAFAAVPLYRIFCQVTGFDGTVSKADEAPDTVLDETVLIRFDTNVRGLPMEFRAEQVSQRVRIGETERAGPYFQKLQCFCFEGQTIQPGETMKFPVQYFVAPEIATDRESRGVREITLSYTFYPTKGAQLAANPAAATGAAG